MGRETIRTAVIDGRPALQRRCCSCGQWLHLTTGNFSPAKRDPITRAVLKWDTRCLKCRALYAKQRYWAMTEEERKARNKRISDYVRERKERDPVFAEYHREMMRQAKRRWLEKDPERARRVEREGRRRRMADPETRARYRQKDREREAKRTDEQKRRAVEMQRMNNRLLRERRDGVPLDKMRSFANVTTPNWRKSVYHRLPSRPLYDAIAAWVVRQDMTVNQLCAAINMHDRYPRQWKTGRQKEVSIHVADRVLTYTGLNWQDVWEDAPEIRRVFEFKLHHGYEEREDEAA